MSLDQAVDEALATYNMSRSEEAEETAEQSPRSKINRATQSRLRICFGNSAFDSSGVSFSS